jgi:hypothetical protein
VKILYSIFFISFILFTSLSKTIVWINYIINYNYIKTELCLNKTKPQLKCNGKCYLNNQIKKTESTPKNFPSTLKIKDEIKFYLEDFNFLFNAPIKSIRLVNLLFDELALSLFYHKIFTPPKIV